MIIIPAIDLKEGKCVRLKQGLMDQSTIFSKNPAEMARRWINLGAKRLHLVDLDGAFAGKPVNENAIKSIVAEVGGEIPIQLGGGIRNLTTVDNFLNSGVNSIIIGTAAVTDASFLSESCEAFPGQIIVGLDAKDGDGMMAGVNIDATVKLAKSLKTPVTASGGVSNIKDIRMLCDFSNVGIRGVITGTAIYEGTLDFKEAQDLANRLTEKNDFS